MCVLVLLRNPLPDWPVVVAANRDEFRARPSEGPQILDRCALAGRDLQGGGTWLGVSRDATVVAITNRRTPPRSDSHSRGRLVMDALLARSWEGRPTGGYNLLIASPRAQVAWEYDGEERMRILRSDLHVISSHRDVDDPDAPDGLAVRRLLRLPSAAFPDHPVPGGTAKGGPCRGIDELRSHLREVQSSHDGDVCKHGDAYGTVSACFVALHRTGLRASQFWCAEGQPCADVWTDRSDLLRQIAG